MKLYKVVGVIYSPEPLKIKIYSMSVRETANSFVSTEMWKGYGKRISKEEVVALTVKTDTYNNLGRALSYYVWCNKDQLDQAQRELELTIKERVAQFDTDLINLKKALNEQRSIVSFERCLDKE